MRIGLAGLGIHGARYASHLLAGDIPGALKPAADRTFVVSGTYVREHGGPIREDEKADVHPATYIGTVTGQTMQLTIRLSDSDAMIGTFMLARGAPGRIVKCL